NRQVENRTLFDVWFKENRRMIHLKEVTPSTRNGRGLTVYETAVDYGDLRIIVSAEVFSAEKDSGPWHLENVTVVDPLNFSTRTVSAEDLDLKTDPATFLVVDPKTDPEGLSIWQLGRVIEELERSGSGVARLRTVWHMKLAYTFSTLCLTLVGLALALSSRNVYLLFFLGMLSVFIYYVVFLTGVAAGQKGGLHPIPAAWGADILLGALALARLAWIFRPVRSKLLATA
ncbi:MAG: LptF/LptG family permease, partial [Deltaproteobacteria bacterium]|nr:LptF/LptG family permease [Deltaproteobacteria bacterium]